VSIRFAESEEAAALPLRKEPVRTGRLRIIQIEDFDISACGGTHVARTGSIGVIAISSWERFKGGTRVEFRCGVRALRSYRSLRDTVAAGIKLLSVAPEELPQGIEHVQAENKEGKRRIRDLEGRLAAHEAEALAARAVAVPGARIVIEGVPDLDMNGLKTIAQHIAERSGHAAALFTSVSPVSAVIARSSDVALDASALLKQLIAQFGGKGGGRPELAQGGGLGGDPREIVQRARELAGVPNT
jgi:alanyl-tRNA synthetase